MSFRFDLPKRDLAWDAPFCNLCYNHYGEPDGFLVSGLSLLLVTVVRGATGFLGGLTGLGCGFLGGGGFFSSGEAVMCDILSIGNALEILRMFLAFLRRILSKDAEKGNSILIEKASVRIVLTELQRQHDVHLAAVDALSSKATSLLEWASLALAIVSAISMPDLANVNKVTPFFLLGVAGILYLAIVILSLSVVFPKAYKLPMTTKWDDMRSYYLTQPEQDALEQILSQYIEVIEHNKLASERKAVRLKAGLALLPLLITALAIMVTYPLWQMCFR